jgi:hypothetical protein
MAVTFKGRAHESRQGLRHDAYAASTSAFSVTAMMARIAMAALAILAAIQMIVSLASTPAPAFADGATSTPPPSKPLKSRRLPVSSRSTGPMPIFLRS